MHMHDLVNDGLEHEVGIFAREEGIAAVEIAAEPGRVDQLEDTGHVLDSGGERPVLLDAQVDAVLLTGLGDGPEIHLHDGEGIFFGHPFGRIHVFGNLHDRRANRAGVANAAPRVENAELGAQQVRVRRQRAELDPRLLAQVSDFGRVGVQAGDVAVLADGEQALAHEEARLDALVAHLPGGLDAIFQALVGVPDVFEVEAQRHAVQGIMPVTGWPGRAGFVRIVFG